MYKCLENIEDPPAVQKSVDSGKMLSYCKAFELHILSGITGHNPFVVNYNFNK